jgi:VIT1/CCC1 family predicted Fe2+/Mn2+ transporter
MMLVRLLLAAFASACSFAIRAALPLVIVMPAPECQLIAWVTVLVPGTLAHLGGLAAKIEGKKFFRVYYESFSGAALPWEYRLGLAHSLGSLYSRPDYKEASFNSVHNQKIFLFED